MLGPDRLELVLADQRHALHVEEEHVPFGVVGEPRLEWHRQQVVLQAHGFGGEDPRVHQLGRAADDGLEPDVGEDVLRQIHPWGDLDELQAVGGELKDAPLVTYSTG